MAQAIKKTIPVVKRTRRTVAFDLDVSIDKAIAIAAIERETTKRQIIEDALRAYLRSASVA